MKPESQNLNYYSETISAEALDRAEENNETALLEELALSWESLQAVYDLNQDFNSSRNAGRMLEKITNRAAAAVGDSASAILWLAEGETFYPSAGVNVKNPQPRKFDSGILSEVFRQNKTLVSNNGRHFERIGASETELKSAQRFAALPISTPLARYGVLTVWNEAPGNNFDSRTARLLETLAVQAAMISETDRLNKESIANEKLQQEIRIGSDIQRVLLTEQPPKGLKSAKISAVTVASNRIDGDFYDFIEYDENCFDLVIGDVMGKGIPAALVGAATKSCFLRAVGQLQYAEQNAKPAPQNIVGWVNAEMTEKLMQFESFVTVCYARFDLAKNYLSFVDGGHTKTIFYDRSRKLAAALEGENMPLGFSMREIFEERIQPFENGDAFLFFSDGITETRNPAGDFFGDRRLSEFVAENAHLEPQKMIDELLGALREFSGEDLFADDLTCVVVKIDISPARPREVWELTLKSDFRELACARRFVRQFAEILTESELADETVSELELAVNETLTNIIRHGINDKNGLIEIRARETGENEIEIAFLYNGVDFDPANAAAPKFDGSQIGGFGLFIVENCVNRVIYARDSEGRNKISLIKKLN